MIDKSESFRNLQAQLGITARELSEKLEVHEATIYRWRCGHSEVPQMALLLLERLCEDKIRQEIQEDQK